MGNIIEKAALTWDKAKAWMVLEQKIAHKDFKDGEWLFMKDKEVWYHHTDGHEERYLGHLSDGMGNPWDVLEDKE